MVKKNAKKDVKKVIDSLPALLEDVYVKEGKFTQYGKFLTSVIRRANEEKDAFAKMIKDKKVALEETPLTRKQFEEEMKKVNEISNPFSRSEFNMKSEDFCLQTLTFYVKHQVTDTKKAEAVISFIWKELDFYSLLFYFNNYAYEHDGEDCYNYDETPLPVSPHTIYADHSFNMYPYQGNLVDRIIKVFTKV